LIGKKDNSAETLSAKSQDLLDAKWRLASIIEGTHTGTWEWNVQTGETVYNEIWAQIIGYTPDELAPVSIKTWEAFAHPDDVKQSAELLKKHFAGELPYFDMDCRMKHKDGHWVWVHDRGRVITRTHEGKPLMMFGIHTDISDHKNLERICLLTNGVPILDDEGNLKGYRRVDEDITEIKKAQALLQQTRINYETFFNTIDEFLFVLDETGNILHANSTVYNRLGYTAEELFQKSVLMVHPSERREEAGRIVGEMLAGKAAFCPVPIVTKSGVQIPVETRVSLGLWDGKPAIFGVTKDISRLRLSEEKFSKLFHLNPSACGLSDLDSHKYIEVNEMFCSLFGFDKHEVIGKTATELGILTHETINVILSNADGNGTVTDAEADLNTKNGDIKRVLLSAENIFVQNKKYRFTVVNDVTKFKQAEDLLKQANTRLTLAARAGGVGVWEYDLVNPALLWDDQMFMLYGIDKKNFSGAYEAWQAGVHPEDRARGDSEIQMAISGEEEFDTEFRVIRPDGTVRNIRALAVVQRDDFGKPLKLVGTNWDITDMKQNEQRLLENEEVMRTLICEKDKFFSIIAHDLRSPFNGFLGLTRIMAEELSTMRLDEIQQMVLKMRRSATNLFTLINNLLEWSRMEQGLIPFNAQVVQLRQIIDESLKQEMESASNKEIAIAIEVAHDLNIFADRDMLLSIVRNLLSNAIKFTPKGGKIFVSAKVSEDKSAEISVRDTGIGMNRAMIDNLFKLDVETNRKGTNGEPSTGLGLHICNDFIKKHGGKLCVESEEGKGSTFSFTLPTTLIPTIGVHQSDEI